MRQITLPPLFTGLATGGDPVSVAREAALKGCDAGLVVYRLDGDQMQAAIVFAPDVALRKAMAILPICGIGFQNALGALAPPEVAVHLDWTGALRLNGAICGALRALCSTNDPAAEPDWLIIGLDLRIWPNSEETGHTPDQTALVAEGCADVDVAELLEAWVRHTLVWINRWQEDGNEPAHKEWTGLAHGINDSITLNGQTGTFIGLDEHLGMLLRTGTSTQAVPLTHLLET